MANQRQVRRGTTTQHASFTGVVAEVTVDITKNTAVVHDGVRAGGYPMQKEMTIQRNGTLVATQPNILNFVGATITQTSSTIVVDTSAAAMLVAMSSASSNTLASMFAALVDALPTTAGSIGTWYNNGGIPSKVQP